MHANMSHPASAAGVFEEEEEEQKQKEEGVEEEDTPATFYRTRI